MEAAKAITQDNWVERHTLDEDLREDISEADKKGRARCGFVRACACACVCVCDISEADKKPHTRCGYAQILSCP